MELTQWIIAISTAVIAAVFLVGGVFLLKVFLSIKALENEFRAQVSSVEHLKKVLFTPSEQGQKEAQKTTRVGKILQSAVLAVALWKTIKKRRSP
jgi:hypothetical protein